MTEAPRLKIGILGSSTLVVTTGALIKAKLVVLKEGQRQHPAMQRYSNGESRRSVLPVRHQQLVTFVLFSDVSYIKMSDEMVKQLASYKAQLHQVEVALSTDSENEDLLKLQKDLQEVIELTKDLLSSQPSVAPDSSDSSAATPQSHSWKAGDSCMAVWTVDGQLYKAEIEEIDEENGMAAVTFKGYGNAEVIPLQSLKPAEQGVTSEESKSRKEQMAEQREYKKKKAFKKAQRIKELEQEREVQKSKWQQFNNKAYSKNKKGQVKRSIFASPESVNGKVGVGTCGIADKPMTQYQDSSKYNVRHLMPQ
ncbi:hypothetical protein AAFF_G00332550 [Aldrovandia affinis]|uniref:Survival of motor neuron-related-splicing factor 30 n=1 Tax=Aldrovandia affinis TaxID=143900 RepID=A0AAD7SMD4_9TELE|nr:hypothetical protein AAFF_G00332550 [Aldrovandia affinis]